jgi:hypothetical protein
MLMENLLRKNTAIIPILCNAKQTSAKKSPVINLAYNLMQVGSYKKKHVTDRDVNDVGLFQPCSIFMFRRKAVEMNCCQFGGYKIHFGGSLQLMKCIQCVKDFPQ